MIAIALLSTAVAVGLAAAGLGGRMPSLRRAPRPAKPSALAVLLRRAGSPHTPSRVVAASIGAAVVTAVVVGTLTPVRVLGLVPALLAAGAPVALLRRRATARTRAVRQAWPDALAQIRGSVRAGRPLTHALIDVSLGGPPVLRAQLTGMAARIQTVGVLPALEAVRQSVAEPVTDRVMEVLMLAHTEGGGIVLEVLDDLAAAVDAEVAAAEEVETLALEGKLNARIVFCLPWLVLVMLTARSGPFQAFYTSAAGAGIIAVGALLSLVGIVVVSRLSATPEEPRVLVRPGEER